MSSIEPRNDEPLTIFDVAIVIGIIAYLGVTIWWAYQASVIWAKFQ